MIIIIRGPLGGSSSDIEDFDSLARDSASREIDGGGAVFALQGGLLGLVVGAAVIVAIG